MSKAKVEASDFIAPQRPSALGGTLFCLGLAAILRFGLLYGIDLRGAFGPDAPGAAASFSSPFQHPYPLHPLAIALLTPLNGGDPLRASLLLSLLASFAAVMAAWRLGRVLSGEHGGRAVGALAATLPMLVYVALLRGGDALAIALAWWGVALAWAGAERLRGEGQPFRVGGLSILAGGLLVGLSAWAKPVALPAASLLLLIPWIGGRGTLASLAAALLLAGGLASVKLAPLLAPREGMGLLGSWWSGGGPPTSVMGWLLLPREGWRVLVGLHGAAPWTMGLPLLLLATLGGFGRGGRLRLRWGLWLSGLLTFVALAALLGDRARPRYFTSAALPWLVLAGYALLPTRFRNPKASAFIEAHRPLVFLDSLPLSMMLTLFTISSARLWEGVGRARTLEEGATPPAGPLSGWTSDFLPLDEFADNGICGGLEIERLASTLAEELPRDALVLAPPLRDGRAWHLRGPLQRARPDLLLVSLDERCCPLEPEACSARIPEALASWGGVLVAPLAVPESCRSGAVSVDLVARVEALDPLLERRLRWVGTLTVERDSGLPRSHPCVMLGGVPSPDPAAP